MMNTPGANSPLPSFLPPKSKRASVLAAAGLEPAFLSVGEWCAVMGMGRTQANEKIRSGLIRSYTSGRSRRIYASEVTDFPRRMSGEGI